MKTLRTIRIVCFVFLLMVGAKLNASDFIVGGICYDVVSFADMTCSVAQSDDEYAGDIIIPERVVYNNRTFTVVCIGDSTFYKCVNLTSVTIPNSVTSIGDSAFEYCSGPDFVNAPPKLRFAVRKVKKWLYGKVLLCQEESFCKERTVFG